eukprot:6182599-Pyramimonas_sp.AAC.1
MAAWPLVHRSRSPAGEAPRARGHGHRPARHGKWYETATKGGGARATQGGDSVHVPQGMALAPAAPTRAG